MYNNRHRIGRCTAASKIANIGQSKHICGIIVGLSWIGVIDYAHRDFQIESKVSTGKTFLLGKLLQLDVVLPISK